MKFSSTRNIDKEVNFRQAIMDPMPEDGGLYFPSDICDLRKWIMFTNEHTSFSSIAGALTLACINEEFSPIICETIATKAFSFEPALKRLDDKHYILELFHGPTGYHRDFGVSYIVSAMETLLKLSGENAIFLDATHSSLCSVLSRELRGCKHLKSVLLFPKGTVSGLEEEDCIWNGGNVYPVEVDGSIDDCHSIIKKIFLNREIVKKYHLTVANTANIGRLIPQMFFYPYAFSRLKKDVIGSIFFAMPPENYSNLVAGLYSWRLALPLNGFIIPADNRITVDPIGNCTILDSIVNLSDRPPSDPSDPSNIERLEEVFSVDRLLLNNFVFPAKVSDQETERATKDLYLKYHYFADELTSKAFAAAEKRYELFQEEGDVVVTIARDNPSFSQNYFKHCLGETPEPLSSNFHVSQIRDLKSSSICDTEGLLKILSLLL